LHGIAYGAALLSGWATDVVASSGVTVAGMLELWFESPYQDFAIGTLIGVHVIKEAIATQAMRMAWSASAHPSYRKHERSRMFQKLKP
jgi:Co/Zn/Cd efflux system component